VAGAIRLGDDEVEALTHRARGAVAEELLCAVTPHPDDPARVGDHHGVRVHLEGEV
jgi:hypothetical protein